MKVAPLAMERFANQNVAACTKVTSTIATKKIQVGFEPHLIIGDSDWSRKMIGLLVKKPLKFLSVHFL